MIKKMMKIIFYVTMISFVTISMVFYIIGFQKPDLKELTINFIFSFLITVVMSVLNHSFGEKLKTAITSTWYIVSLIFLNSVTLIIGLYSAQFVTALLGLADDYFFLSGKIFWLVLVLSFVLTVFVVLYTNLKEYAEKLAERLAEEKSNALHLEIMKKQAELELLQSKVNPHFLFNAMNSIVSIIKKEPGLAEDMLVKLSALLRKSLNFNTKLMIPLEEEITFLTHYLDLEKLRFTDRMTYEIQGVTEFKNYKIPALILQPIVENAVKHGIEEIKEPAQITITVEKKGSSLMIVISDNGVGIQRFERGFGLSGIEERLKLIYGKKGALELETGKGTSVTLILPFYS